MIRKPYYVQEAGGGIWKVPETGLLVYSIQGLDANALYLWCLMQAQLCGKLVYHDYNNEDLSNMFGIIVVDIETPPELYNKFSEFPPIFMNVEIGTGKDKATKLTSVYSAKKMPIINTAIALVFGSWIKINEDLGLYSSNTKYYI